MINNADPSEVNRLEHSMSEDLDPNWNEPATRGDLRLLAMRIDAEFDLLRGNSLRIVKRAETKPHQFFGEFTRTMNYVWVALAYVVIVTSLGTLWIATILSK